MASNVSMLTHRMSSKKVHDAYLNTQTLIALSKTMSLAGMILGFDIVELWSEDAEKKLFCAYVYASDDIITKYPDIIVGHYPEHKREHKLSPQLCQLARESSNRCYWKIIDKEHPRSTPQPLHPDLVKTEVCYWVEGEFDGLNIFIVGFSSMMIKMKTSKLKFLNGLGYAIYVAAFDLDDDYNDDDDDDDQHDDPNHHDNVNHHDDATKNHHKTSTNDLDNKEFVPRALSTPYSSVNNFNQMLTGPDGLPMSLSTLSLGSSPPINFGISSSFVASSSNQLSNQVSNQQTIKMTKSSSNVGLSLTDSPTKESFLMRESYDSNDVGLTLNPSISSSTVQFDSHPIQDDDQHDANKLDHHDDVTNLAPRNSVSSSSSSQVSTFLPPTWSPIDAFAFHVADINVRSWVPDNLTMNHFQDVKHVADGSNSHIYLAKFDGVKVIVKVIKESAQYDSVAIHEFEVEHGLLIRLNHPNIIKLLGAGRAPRRFIVLEYLGGGTLNTILAQNQVSGITSKIFRRPSFTYSNLIAKLRDMAEAFDYLHTKCHPQASIIHRDLKPDNVGFTDAGVLKLFDFGLCTCVKRRASDTEAYEMTGNTGSLRYMAPEVALRKPYTEKVDVYSFGIMAWQMARDKVPFKGMSRDEFYRVVVVGNERPQLDKAWPIGFSNLLTSCWSADPILRPSFSQIVFELSRLIDDVSAKPTPKKGKSMSNKPDGSKPSPPSSTWF